MGLTDWVRWTEPLRTRQNNQLNNGFMNYRELTQRDLLDRIESRTIFSVRKVDGVQYVHMLGYYYDAECSMEDDGRNWRYVMFGGLDFTLDELRAMSEDDIYEVECECKQWIDDLTEDEVAECFLEEVPVELHYLEVTDDTPEGVYIAI